MRTSHYPSDLTDAHWAVLEPLVPIAPTGCPRRLDMREVLNASFYVLRTGCAWRYLPSDLPKWQSVYYYYRIWRDDGTWQSLMDRLREQDRVRVGRHPEPSGGIMDRQSVKTTEKGGSSAMMAASR
jgi:putative transposase